jgi:hypothetical protein
VFCCGAPWGPAPTVGWTRLIRPISTTRTGAAGAGAACRSCWTVAAGSGRPGFFARPGCCRSNGTGAGAGAVRATTGRLNTLAGGRGARDAVSALTPRTLSRCGAIAGAPKTWAEESCAEGTARASCVTRLPRAKVCCGTAVTPF